MEENKDINEIEDFRDSYLRAVADYQNLKNRVAKDRLTMVENIRNEFVKKLLPLYDVIWSSTVYSHDNDGKNLILKKFEDTLKDFGVDTIKDLENQEYDSDIAEAVNTQDTLEPHRNNKIYKTIKNGFKDANSGKVIEFAKVVVYKFDDKF